MKIYLNPTMSQFVGNSILLKTQGTGTPSPDNEETPIEVNCSDGCAREGGGTVYPGGHCSEGSEEFNISVYSSNSSCDELSSSDCFITALDGAESGDVALSSCTQDSCISDFIDECAGGEMARYTCNFPDEMTCTESTGLRVSCGSSTDSCYIDYVASSP